MSIDFRRARFLLLAITGFSYAVIGPLSSFAGLAIDYNSVLLAVAWLGGGLVCSSLYCTWRGMLPLRNLVEPVLLGLLMTLPTVAATYLAIRMGLPLADETLATFDAAMGFDWRAFVQLVDDRPWLSSCLGVAYQSFAVQLIALPLLLSLSGKAARAYAMVAAYSLICFMASAIAVRFPAIGAYPFYGVGGGSLGNINVHFGYFFLEQFNAVRDDPSFVFSMVDAAGILTFPSVHAACAALCAWAAWSIRTIRYPVLILNGAMAAAAISHGSHYFIDVPAGMLLAAFCIAIVRVAVRERSWPGCREDVAPPVAARDRGSTESEGARRAHLPEPA